MIYRRLGRTELMVSEAGFGGWPIGGQGWGDVRDEQSLAALQKAVELGVNFFDTAEGYGDGHSEEVLGRALEGRRDGVVIATKVSQRHLTEDLLKQSCETSLRRLRIDCVDVYQVHWPNHSMPFAETVGLLEKLREAGAPAAALGTDQAHRRSPLGGQVGNLVLKLPGTHRGVRRLLMAHLDTVPLCIGTVPVVRGNYVAPADKHNLGRTDFCLSFDPPKIVQHGWTVVFEREQHPNDE